ncbi:hypothetical protein Tco_0920389, partial [Tanacetum coccineum]
LVEAARTMLIFSKLPEFLWAEAISTACFNQNRSLVHPRTRKIIETIHVKFDELTIMASKCNNSGPSVNCLNFQGSSKEMNDIPSQQALDNLFGPLYEEYYVPRAPEVSNNSAANTLDTEVTPSSSSIIVEDSDAPQIVTSSEEPIA